MANTVMENNLTGKMEQAWDALGPCWACEKGLHENCIGRPCSCKCPAPDPVEDLELLSTEEIKAMNAYLEEHPPMVGPPPDLSFFDVRRIAATLQYLQFEAHRLRKERDALEHLAREWLTHYSVDEALAKAREE